MKRLIIADCSGLSDSSGNPIGHYVTFASSLKSVLSSAYDVTIACPKNHQRFLDGPFITIPSSFGCFASGKLTSRLKRFFNEMKNIVKVLSHKSEYVVFQSGSILAMSLALSLSRHKRINHNHVILVQYVDQLSGRSIKEAIARFVYSRVKKDIMGVITGDKSIGEVYSDNYAVISDVFGESLRKPSIVPDFDFCILGVINKGKGCLEVIRAIKNTKFSAVIAGHFSSEEYKNEVIREVGHASNIHVRDGYLSRNQYKLLIEKSRYAVLAYPIEFIRSSGFFYDALLSLRPVIVSSAPFFKIVEEKRLGLRYTKEFSEVLSLVKNEELYRDFQKNIEVFVSEKLMSDMSEISRFFGVELEEVHDDLYGEKETYSNINEESL